MLFKINMEKSVTPAEELFVDGQFEYAIYLYTNLIEDEVNGAKTKADAYTQRATCYLNMFKYYDAYEDLNNAQKLNRLNSSAYIKLSKCCLLIGYIKEAITAMTNLLHVSEDADITEFARNEKQKLEEIERKETIAKEAFKKEQYEKVVELMNECLQISEICVRHRALKAKCLIYLQRFEEALATINEILFINKNDLEAVCIRGLNLLHQEKYMLGLEDLKQIVYDNPQGKVLYEMYKDVEKDLREAEEYKKSGKLDAAIKIFTKYLKLDPENSLQIKSMSINLTQIYLQQNNLNEAMMTCINALIIDANDIQVLSLRAEISTKLKEYADAIDDYIKITRLDPSDKYKKLLINAEDLLKKNPIDHYKMLGVKQGCSKAEIKKAWKQHALKYHPDKLSDKTKAEKVIGKRKFDRIKESYDKLMK